MKLGAQFFTLRDFCQDLDSFSESLKKVAEIGYKTVQISGTCAFEAEWLKAELDKNGLECVITHTPAEKLLHQTEKAAQEHDVFGCRYVGLGSFPFNGGQESESYAEFLRLYKPVASKLKALGKYFMYHNHSGEFQKAAGRLILRAMAEDIPTDEMGFTLDTYWVQAGGGDPAWWIEFLKGRVPCIHLKDYAYGGKMAVVGEGNINFDRVFEKAQEAGTEYMLVEQDECDGENPFSCLKRSYDYLHSLGFN